MFSFLKNVKQHTQKVLFFCEATLISLRDAAESFYEDFPDELKSCIDAVKKTCRAVMYLLSPLPAEPSLQADAIAVNDCNKYTGDNKLLRLVRDVLRKDPWTGLWQEALSRGAATLEAADEINSLRQKLENEPTVSILTTVMKKSLKWKTSLRSGAITLLEQVAMSVAKTQAEKVVAEGGKGVSASTVDCLLQALQLQSPPMPDTLQTAGKLQKLRTTNAKHFAAMDLQESLETLPSDGDVIPGNDALSVTTLLQALKAMEVVDDELVPRVWLAGYWLLRRAQVMLKD